MADPLRVAYTFELCWHDVPGGSAVAALEVARRLAERPDVELVGVAGRHRRPPADGFVPPVPVQPLPLKRPWLYEMWNQMEWPRIESATGPVDVCHSTVAIPAATTSPQVVTIHDLAFVERPELFTRHGRRVMERGLERALTAQIIMCPSVSIADDLVEYGFDRSRIRVVPWGVESVPVTEDDLLRVHARHRLPAEFVLFVGTIEPRKNLTRLAEAIEGLGIPLVVAGVVGWGGVQVAAGDVRFLGFVPDEDLRPLMTAASVLAYPSLQEGFGLPILEAMAQGTAVVTSRSGATEEVAGGAAVLVDPLDVASIRAGVQQALDERGDWAARAAERAATSTWAATTEATVAAYRDAVA